MIVAAPLAIALAAAAPAQARPVPVQTYTIKAVYPHDPRAFTQGLFFRDGFLYESTGLEGRSTVRKVRLTDGKVVQSAAIAPEHFGEGSTALGDQIISVTWRNGVGYRWDRATLKLRGRFNYVGEGWGLTSNGRQLIMSDGSPVLQFLNPATFAPMRRLRVTAAGRPVPLLNELEWINGEIWANVFQSDRIARIDPATGQVRSWIDLSGLRAQAGARGPESVLNGIAYDAHRGRLFVTGKLWSKLFEIEVRPAR